MRLFQISIPKLTLVVIVASLCLSCSKDADLISDYVINDSDDIAGVYAQLVNDTYFIDRNTSVVLDVLSNDTFKDLNKVTIVETSDPAFGTVVINEDKTLTYIPNPPVTSETETPTETPEETEEPQTPTETPEETETATEEEVVEDTFVYTAEETNEAGEVTTSEATVTVSNAVNKVPTIGSHVFYVTTNGKSTNTGKTQGSAWDITHAFKAAKAGDIIHIKAGNYGSKNLEVNNSGTAGNPIRFIGYRNEPGDVVSNQGSTFNYGEQVDATKMPLIQGTRTNNEGIGEGIVISESNIHLSNFQIKYFEKGLRSSGDNNMIENIIVTDVGDFNPEHSKENAGNAFVNYNGVGIVIEGNNVVFKNSVVVNAGAEGIHAKRATNQVHSYNSVYSDNSTNPCDYYYLFSASSHNNIIDHALIYRENGLSHYGHGLICKEDATNNIFTNFEIRNTILELSYSGVSQNLFENGIIEGSFNRVERKNRPGGVLVANGAHHNTLKNIIISKVESVISFGDWDSNGELNQNDAGNNNTFIDLQAEDSEIAINFDEFKKLEGKAHNNLFKNCDFKNMDRLFHVNRPNSNNKFEGCTFENIDKFQSTSNDYGYMLNPNTIFTNVTSINLGFLLP